MFPRWHLSHIQGYLELGLVEEAASELEAMPPELWGREEVMAARVAVLQAQERWPELVAAAGELAKAKPGMPQAWIAWAYATRRAVSLAAAEAILREAERLHGTEPVVHYNLGCYAAVQGDLVQARRRVIHACRLSRSLISLAAEDPDLEALRATGFDVARELED